MSERRALRGFVRWVVRPTRKNDGVLAGFPPRNHRHACYAEFYDMNRVGRGLPKRTCLWCWTPLDAGQNWQANFHADCARLMAIAKGQRFDLKGPVIPQAPCACGQPGTELDHIVPLALAVQAGLRAWVRAFFPANLEWKCVGCHAIKTRADMRDIADRKAGRVRMPLGDPTRQQPALDLAARP